MSECAWLIRYDDPDRPEEVFVGRGAEVSALARYAEVSASWNAHLFRSHPCGSCDQLRQEFREAAAQSERFRQAAVKKQEENERLRAELAEARKALQLIQRTPAMPFPDPRAHSDKAFGEAVWRAWLDIQRIASAALNPVRSGVIGAQGSNEGQQQCPSSLLRPAVSVDAAGEKGTGDARS